MSARLLRIAAAVLALALAAALALVGRDVQLWPARVARDDLAFAAGRTAAWRTPGRPWASLSERLLGLHDDLAFRRTLALVRATGSVPLAADAKWLQRLAKAEQGLAAAEEHERNPARASAAANLLGITYFEGALVSGEQAAASLQASLAAFQRAVALDPDNGDAKFNLELLLQLLRVRGDEFGWNPYRRGSESPGTGLPGNTPPGQGY